MLKLECPNCGARNASEFRYGGENTPRPQDTVAVADDEWISYLYERKNLMGVQIEWWYHRAGCGLWFLVERDRRNNKVSRTWRWQADATGSVASNEGAS